MELYIRRSGLMAEILRGFSTTTLSRVRVSHNDALLVWALMRSIKVGQDRDHANVTVLAQRTRMRLI